MGKPDEHGLVDERPTYQGALKLEDIKVNRGYIWHCSMRKTHPRIEYIQFLTKPTKRHKHIQIRYLASGIENFCALADLGLKAYDNGKWSLNYITALPR